MKRRNPIHAYKRLLAKDYDWDYAYLIALEKKKLQRMHDCITSSGITICWDGGTKVSPPSTPYNPAYYTAHHQSRSASFGENGRKTNTAADGSSHTDSLEYRPSPSAPVLHRPSGLHLVWPKCIGLDENSIHRTKVTCA